MGNVIIRYSDRFKETVLDKMKHTFKISKENSTAFKYLGIEVFKDDNGIYLSQVKYAKELKEIILDKAHSNDKNRQVTKEEKTKLRSVIGRLNWLSTITRPDIAYEHIELSTKLKQAFAAYQKLGTDLTQ